MKKINMTITIALFISLCAQAQVVEEVDEFTGEVTYQTEPFSINVEKGDVITSNGFFMRDEEGRYFFAHYTVSTEWQHLMEDTYYFVVDGNRKQYTTAYSDSDMKTSGSSIQLIEAAGVLLTEDHLKEISGSVSARFRFGSNVYEIPMRGKQYAQRLLEEAE